MFLSDGKNLNILQYSPATLNNTRSLLDVTAICRGVYSISKMVVRGKVFTVFAWTVCITEE